MNEVKEIKNFSYDLEVEWNDFVVVGVGDMEGFDVKVLDLLEVVGLDIDIYCLGF